MVVGHVDDQPPGGRGAANQLDACHLADGAAASVRTDEIAGPDRRRPAVPGELGGDAGAVLIEACQLGPEVQLDAGEPVDTPPERSLEQGLQEEVAPGPPERLGTRLNVREAATPGRVVPDGGVLDDVGQEFVDQAGRLVGAQRLVVNADGSREIEDRAVPVDDDRRDFVDAEQVAHGDAARAGPHHEDFGLQVGCHASGQEEPEGFPVERFRVLEVGPVPHVGHLEEFGIGHQPGDAPRRALVLVVVPA